MRLPFLHPMCIFSSGGGDSNGDDDSNELCEVAYVSAYAVSESITKAIVKIYYNELTN